MKRCATLFFRKCDGDIHPAGPPPPHYRESGAEAGAHCDVLARTSGKFEAPPAVGAGFLGGSLGSHRLTVRSFPRGCPRGPSGAQQGFQPRASRSKPAVRGKASHRLSPAALAGALDFIRARMAEDMLMFIGVAVSFGVELATRYPHASTLSPSQRIKGLYGKSSLHSPILVQYSSLSW